MVTSFGADNPTSPRGQRGILADMLANVQGIQNDQFTDRRYRPPTVYYPITGGIPAPRLQPPGEETNSSLEQNEMPQTISGDVYIRAVGTTPGTLNRMKRVVAKQRLCYGTPFFAAADVKEQQNVAVPVWLDTDFLYRINYGPGTQEDVKLARETLHAAKTQRGGRLAITLLDPEMAKILHRAIFSKSRIDSLKTDWTEADVDVEDVRRNVPWTPFNYSSSEEIEPLLWCEEYVVCTLWSRHYSSSILGEDRPPMAGVARDIISLITYLAHSYFQPRPLLDCLKDFPTPLFSIPLSPSPSVDMEWASQGLLADMFGVAIARGHTVYGRRMENTWLTTSCPRASRRSQIPWA
jgi:hypothetical protein